MMGARVAATRVVHSRANKNTRSSRRIEPDDHHIHIKWLEEATCRKRTQHACNKSRTTAGKIIAVSMLSVILLSILMIILDSMNYNYCANKCPPQLTNGSYSDEWSNEAQQDYILGQISEDLYPRVTSWDIEPSGSTFFLVHFPNIVKSTCQAPEDTYCTYIRTDGVLTYSMLFALEIFCTLVFTVEFFVRLAVAPVYCPSCYKGEIETDHDQDEDDSPFFTQAFTYLDFVAILPFYIDVAASALANDGSITAGTPGFFFFLDIFKLFRVCRIFKLIRLFKRSAIVFKTLKRSFKPICLSLVVFILIYTTGGAIMVMLEPCNSRPQPFASSCQFQDIFQAGYYSWITILTVGYGDQVPQTLPGRTVGIIMMISGSIFLAMPLTILGTKFETAFNEYETKHRSATDQQDMNVDDMCLPMSDRKMRLRRNGMICFDRILRAEECLKKHHEDDEPDELLDADDVDKLTNSISCLHYNIAKDLGAVYPSLQKIVPDKPASLVPFDETAKSSESKTETLLRKKKRCCTTSAKVVPDGEVAPKKKTKADYVLAASSSKASRRDKLWLWLEYPDYSRSAKIGYFVREFLLILSFGLTMFSAFPEFQLSYGPAAPSCERAAREYCNNIRNLPDDWAWPGDGKILDWSPRWQNVTKKDVMAANPYCFNMTCEMLNAAPDAHAFAHGMYKAPPISEQHRQQCRDAGTNPTEMLYSGCEGVSNAGCAWPLPNASYISYKLQCPATLSSETIATPPTNTIVDGKLVTTQTTITSTTYSGPQPFDTTSLGQQVQELSFWQLTKATAPVCQRKVCQDMESTTYGWIKILGRPYGFNKLFLILSIIAVIFFTLEFALRLFAMRSPKRFFSSVSNWVELICAVWAVYEVIVVAFNYNIGMSGSAEAGVAWGYESFGAPAFGRLFPSDQFRMWCLIVPIRFVLQTKDAPIVRVIWLTMNSALRKLLIPIFMLVLIVVVLSGVLYTVETLFCCTVAKVRIDEFDPGAVSFRYVPSYPHTFFGDAGQAEMSRNPTLCVIQNYMDAIWLGFVTMTTVGYGVFSPNVVLGKIIGLTLGLFGAFYMAMPLTIVGATFYRQYKQDSEREHRQKMMLKFRNVVNRVIIRGKLNTKREIFARGAHVLASTNFGEWKEAVIMKVHEHQSHKNYDVQWEDGHVDQYLSDKLVRPLDGRLAALAKQEGTTEDNLTAFREFIELPPLTRLNFRFERICQWKERHLELMRCLGNITEDDRLRTGAPKLRQGF